MKIKKLRQDAILPEYAHPGDAGFDLCSVSEVHLGPGEWDLIPTGLAVALPPGYELQVRPRSGLALKEGITVLNSPGTIDSGYRGEVGVILINHSKKTFVVRPGMRIAQGVVARHETVNLEVVDSLDETSRGQGGFGSTGVLSDA